MICVECGRPVATLYTEYSKGNIRPTQCDNCQNFADKYIEQTQDVKIINCDLRGNSDFVLIVIDLLLHKPQVYRHLLFNRLEYLDKGINSQVLRLAGLLLLFDVYLKWGSMRDLLFQRADFTQLILTYVHVLCSSLLEQFAFHLLIRSLIAITFNRQQYAIIKYNYVSIALIISSFAKLLLVLMIIWDFSQTQYTWLVGLYVLSSNVEALAAFLDCKYVTAGLIVIAGALIKAAIQLLLLPDLSHFIL